MELATLGDGGNVGIRLEDLDVGVALDVAGAHFAGLVGAEVQRLRVVDVQLQRNLDRKSTRLNSSHGYISADKNFDEDLGIGWIPIDSVHSPIKKVNYLVEAARLGQTTDYEKLTVDVWTNGSVSARDGVSLAAKLIRDHLNIFINLEESGEAMTDAASDQPHAGISNENLDKSVEELELSVRSYNCLKNANIRTIRELVQKTEAEMLKTKNFGRKSLNEIKEILQTMGLGLGMKIDQAATASQE